MSLKDGRTARIRPVLDVGHILESMSVESKGERRAAAPDTVERVRVGGNVTPPRLVHAARAVYPDAAKKAGVEGEVVVQAVILMDGSVGKARVVSSPDPLLADAATKAIEQWRYEPVRLNGMPVESITQITLQFKLD